jgi:hypothetical protein
MKEMKYRCLKLEDMKACRPSQPIEENGWRAGFEPRLTESEFYSSLMLLNKTTKRGKDPA